MKKFEEIDFSLFSNAVFGSFLSSDEKPGYIDESWDSFDNELVSVVDVFGNCIKMRYSRLNYRDARKVYFLYTEYRDYSHDTVRISIYKLKDEWYYIYESGLDYVYRYKCDQIDGLVECLKKIKDKRMSPHGKIHRSS